MTSNIDPTVPVTGDPTTASVRGNFQVAHDEITALQIATSGAPFVPVAGTTMTGPLYLSQDPTSGRQAVTKDYFDTHAAGGVGGIPEAPSDGVLYGRQSGGWVHAAAPADITAAIGAALVPATTTVAGIGTIATSALVNAGTDATAWVTSATLAARLAVALAPYVPLAGSSTIVGSIILAPTGGGANPTLTLNRPDGTGLDAIIGQQAGAEYWRINLVDASNNFAIRRSIGASPGPMLTLESATNAATFGGIVGGVTIGPPGNTGGALAILGAATAVSAGTDYLVIAARRLLAVDSGGSYRDGGQIFLFGPSATAPNAGAINLAAGTSASGYKSFVFGPDGSLTGPGNASFSGTLASGGTLSVGGGFNVSAAGVVNAAGAATFAASVSTPFLQGGTSGAANAGSLMMRGNAGTLNFSTPAPYVVSYYVNDGPTAGLRIATTSNVTDLTMLPSGGPVNYTLALYDTPQAGGNLYGIYVDGVPSDARIKRNIADTTVDALAALLAIPLRSFEYIENVLPDPARIDRRTEPLTGDDDVLATESSLARRYAEPWPVDIGWVAQEVGEVIPDAVVTFPAVRNKDPDDPMPDDAMSVVPHRLIPYLLRAVQQLADRLAALEGSHRK